MAMSSSVLASELESVVPEALEADAIENMADAYAAYAEDAQALTTITPAGVALGRAAFVSNLSGVSGSGAGAAKLALAIREFWVAVAGGLATSFTGATAISPPSTSLTSGHLQDVFDDNTDLSRTLAASVSALATAIHAQVGGGTVTTAGPVVTPIT